MDLARAILSTRRQDRAWDTGMAQGPAVDGWISVNCSGAVEKMWCPAGISPALGDVLAILRGGTPVVAGILALGDALDPDLGPRAPSEVDAGIARFPALYTWTWQRDTAEGTYPSAWKFTHDQSVTQGDSWGGDLPTRHGYWFWNWTVTTALHGATVDSTRIRLPRSTNGPDSATVTLVFRDIVTQWPSGSTTPDGYPAEPSNAGAAVTLVSADIGRRGASWTDLPADQVQYMLDAKHGAEFIPPPNIGIVGADNIVLQGVDTDPASGLLEIRWHR